MLLLFFSRPIPQLLELMTKEGGEVGLQGMSEGVNGCLHAYSNM